MAWTLVKILLISYFLASNIAGNSQSSVEFLAQINANISNGKAGENYALYQEKRGQGFFDSLDCITSGKIFHRIGVSLYFADVNLEAADFYKTVVLPNWESCPQKKASDYANSLYNTGVSLQFAENYREARSYFYKSLQLFEADSTYSKIRLSTKYAGIARFYKEAQAYVRAEDYYKTAIELVRSTSGQEIRKAGYYQDVGITLNDSKKFAEAIPYFLEAISIYSEYQDQRKLAMTYHNISISYLSIDSLSVAEEHVNRAASLHSDNLNFLSNDLEVLGLINAKRGKQKESERFLKRSLVLRKKFKGNNRAISSSYENLAELYFSQDKNIAVKYIDSAIFTLIINPAQNDFGNPIISHVIALNEVSLIRAMGLKAQMIAKNSTNQESQLIALDLYSKIDSLLTINLFNLHFEKSRLAYLELLYEHYPDVIKLCHEMDALYPNSGYDKLGFGYSSKTKSLVLVSELNEKKLYNSESNNKLDNTIIQATRNINNLYSEILESGGDSVALIASYLKAQRELEEKLNVQLTHNTKNNLAKYDLSNPMSVEEIQKRMLPHQLYLEFLISPDQLISYWITQDTFAIGLIPNTELVENLVASLQSLVSIRNGDIDSIDQIRGLLSNLLLPSWSSDITQDAREWLIVPDGILHQLSFDLLTPIHGNESYLIEEVDISTSYTSRLLFYNQSRKINSTYQGYGTSYAEIPRDNARSNNILPPSYQINMLANAEKEISRSQEIMNGTSFLGAAASKFNFIKNWNKSDILHLSLHGFVDKNFYEKSCLIFDNRESDNLLLLSDVYAMDNNIDLAVLSSCYTASGQFYKGEGIQGITKSFLKSGKTTVISSLWEASDLSASRIIPFFFNRLKKGLTLTKSLKEAKIEYLKNATPSQRHPYYWANFQIIGQGDISLDRGYNNLLWILGGLILILILFLKLFKSKN